MLKKWKTHGGTAAEVCFDMLDNRASQLEWITQSDNIKHAWRLGLITRKRGKEHAHIHTYFSD